MGLDAIVEEIKRESQKAPPGAEQSLSMEDKLDLQRTESLSSCAKAKEIAAAEEAGIRLRAPAGSLTAPAGFNLGKNAQVA